MIEVKLSTEKSSHHYITKLYHYFTYIYQKLLPTL